MPRRIPDRLRRVVLPFVLLVFASGCADGPTAPSTQRTSVPSTRGNLQFTSAGVSDAGQDGAGQWLYRTVVYLRENGGLDVIVTSIRVEALVGATALATASIAPTLLVRANSSGDATLVLASGTHVGVADLTARVTVEFNDARGNTGSVSGSFSCFGCWDY